MSSPDVEVYWHEHATSRSEREKLNGNRGCILWFTGLSGSGKSTIANVVDHKLHEMGKHSFVLDGDNVRHSLNASPQILESRGYSASFGKRFGLGFSAEDREENIRRIGAVSKLFVDAGIIALTAFISPYRKDRDAVRAVVDQGDFYEIYVNTPLKVCEARDPKGLYKKARAGQIKGFTGIDDPYEAPIAPDLTLDASENSAEELGDEVVYFLRTRGVI
ncbi:MAG: adenylyl-sulfate kinase [Planctomycetia bacterium]|nr:adenylyl-sulfate kinase [Planctomycetia bacterium]